MLGAYESDWSTELGGNLGFMNVICQAVRYYVVFQVL